LTSTRRGTCLAQHHSIHQCRREPGRLGQNSRALARGPRSAQRCSAQTDLQPLLAAIPINGPRPERSESPSIARNRNTRVALQSTNGSPRWLMPQSTILLPVLIRVRKPRPRRTRFPTTRHNCVSPGTRRFVIIQTRNHARQNDPSAETCPFPLTQLRSVVTEPVIPRRLSPRLDSVSSATSLRCSPATPLSPRSSIPAGVVLP
jgi:hypothetical protein